MKTLYIDPFSGISGNMFIGALLDLGLKADGFLDQLEKMGIPRDQIIIKKVVKQGISASYFNLRGEEDKLDHDHHGHHGDHSHQHRKLKDLLAIIDSSGFSDQVKNTAKKIYHILAEAEAHVHGSSVNEVHFHEVGDLDSIVDCLGAAYFFHALDLDRVAFGTINTGAGMVKCAHGDYPIPTPATSYILTKIQAPIGGVYVDKELTTPTGAAIVATLYDQFQMRPQGRVLATGYGAGSRDNNLANVLRVMILQEEEALLPVWYSCNVDDMTGEELGFLMERLFEKGARDVSFTPIFMKKNRPGQRVDVLGDYSVAEDLKNTLFRHSSTLGIKEIPIEKYEMNRRLESISFLDGLVRKKTASYGDISKSSYEYEDIRELARIHDWTLKEVVEKLDQGSRD